MNNDNIITVEAENSEYEGRGQALSIAGQNEKLAMATIRMHILQSSDIDEAAALFYSYGENSPGVFKGESCTKLLKDIYAHYHVSIPEKIEGVATVSTDREYILKYLSETIPNLIQDGKIKKSIIDEIVKSDGILSVLMQEVEDCQSTLLEDVSEYFSVLKSLAKEDTKSITSAEAQMVGKIKREYHSKIARFKKVLEESDTRTLIGNLAAMAENFANEPSKSEASSVITNKDLEKISKASGKKLLKEIAQKIEQVPTDNKSSEILQLLNKIIDEGAKKEEPKKDRVDLSSIAGSPFAKKETSLGDVMKSLGDIIKSSNDTKKSVEEWKGQNREDLKGIDEKLSLMEEKYYSEKANSNKKIEALIDAVGTLEKENKVLSKMLKHEIEESENIRHERKSSQKIKKEVVQDV